MLNAFEALGELIRLLVLASYMLFPSQEPQPGPWGQPLRTSQETVHLAALADAVSGFCLLDSRYLDEPPIRDLRVRLSETRLRSQVSDAKLKEYWLQGAAFSVMGMLETPTGFYMLCRDLDRLSRLHKANRPLGAARVDVLGQKMSDLMKLGLGKRIDEVVPREFNCRTPQGNEYVSPRADGACLKPSHKRISP